MVEIVQPISTVHFGFYTALIIVLLLIVLMVYFIIKLKQSFKEIMKTFGISLLITLLIEFVVLLPFSFWNSRVIFCEGLCRGPWKIFQRAFPRTIIFIFLIVLFVYYLVKFIRNRKPNI